MSTSFDVSSERVINIISVDYEKSNSLLNMNEYNLIFEADAIFIQNGLQYKNDINLPPRHEFKSENHKTTLIITKKPFKSKLDIEYLVAIEFTKDDRKIIAL